MLRTISLDISKCIRCGTCCRKGGPVLHHEDKQILLKGHISYQHLMTLRKGEKVFDPVKEKFENLKVELIKIKNSGDGVSCYFFNETLNSCLIYENRPIECRLLRCWDTSDIIKIIGKNTLKRKDIINPDDPVIEIIDSHERDCPGYETEKLLSSINIDEREQVLKRLTSILQKDLSIRKFTFEELKVSRDYEFFLFGRPMTRILKERGLTVKNSIE